MKQSLLLFSFLALSFVFSLASCTKKESIPLSQMTAAQLSEHGKSVYTANCISCHNQDPQKDGSIGPAVAGANQELLEAKVLRAEYPAQYLPKRDSRTMPALPFLKDELSALTAYLSALSPKGADNP